MTTSVWQARLLILVVCITISATASLVFSGAHHSHPCLENGIAAKITGAAK